MKYIFKDYSLAIENFLKAIKKIKEYQKNIFLMKLDIKKALNILESFLKPRDSKLLKMRFLNNMTLKTAGKKLNISYSRTAQIEELILRKLKNYYENIKKQNEMNCTAIEAINLSPRTNNALINSGIETVEQLLSFPEEKLLEIRGLGAKGIYEIQEFKNKYLL